VPHLRVNVLDNSGGQRGRRLLVVKGVRASEPDELRCSASLEVRAAGLTDLCKSTGLSTGVAGQLWKEDGGASLALSDKVSALPPLAEPGPTVVAKLNSGHHKHEAIEVPAIGATRENVKRETARERLVPRHDPPGAVLGRVVEGFYNLRGYALARLLNLIGRVAHGGPPGLKRGKHKGYMAE